MKHVPIAMFKDKVSHYVAEAAAGEEIIITRHGKEAARLSAPAKDRMALKAEAVARMVAFGERYRAKYGPTKAEDIRSMLEESRT